MAGYMNIYQRISAVMKEVSYLNKDAYVETGVRARTSESKDYYALTAEKVLGALRPLLIKFGIVIIPCNYTVRRTDESLIGFDGKPRPNRMTEIEGTYRIQSIDDPSDYVMAVSCDQGADAQDKGTGKAMTYSYKYLLTTVFAIPSGEEPDKIHSDAYTDDLQNVSPLCDHNFDCHPNKHRIIASASPPCTKCATKIIQIPVT